MSSGNAADVGLNRADCKVVGQTAERNINFKIKMLFLLEIMLHLVKILLF